MPPSGPNVFFTLTKAETNVVLTVKLNSRQIFDLCIHIICTVNLRLGNGGAGAYQECCSVHVLTKNMHRGAESREVNYQPAASPLLSNHSLEVGR